MSCPVDGALAPLAQHDLVLTVRAGVGLLGAVQLRPDALAERPDLGLRLVAQARERGVLTRMLADGSVQVSPPFVVTRDELRQIAEAIDDSLVALGSSRQQQSLPDVDLLPSQTRDDAGGFDALDDRLLAEVPPHHVA